MSDRFVESKECGWIPSPKEIVLTSGGTARFEEVMAQGRRPLPAPSAERSPQVRETYDHPDWIVRERADGQLYFESKELKDDGQNIILSD